MQDTLEKMNSATLLSRPVPQLPIELDVYWLSGSRLLSPRNLAPTLLRLLGIHRRVGPGLEQLAQVGL